MATVKLVGWPAPRGAKLRRLPEATMDRLEKRKKKVNDAVLRVAYERSPVGKGAADHRRIRDSWSVSWDGSGDERSVTLENAAPHLGFYVKGTKPHEIRPVKRKALAFPQGGTTIVRRAVNHPGTKPHPLDRRVLDGLRKELTSLAGGLADDAAKELKEVFTD